VPPSADVRAPARFPASRASPRRHPRACG
jgi:hypothetical protein